MNKLKNACSVILKNDDMEIKHATKNQWINNEIKEEIKKNWDSQQWKYNHTESMGCNKSSS